MELSWFDYQGCSIQIKSGIIAAQKLKTKPMLLQILQSIVDHRRAQAKQYGLGHILLFSILAIASGADSYRKIADFISEHFEKLKQYFNLDWKNPPAYTTIRNIIQGVNSAELEKAFRKYSRRLAKLDGKKYRCVGLDGKTLKGSFDNFEDKKAMQIFSAFLHKEKIILAHEVIEDVKTNEIPVAQKLIKALGLSGCIFTGDAMHCQKKH